MKKQNLILIIVLLTGLLQACNGGKDSKKKQTAPML